MMASPVLIPPAVRPGDRIGVAALSGALPRLELAQGLARLEKMGFEPVLADNVRAALDRPNAEPSTASNLLTTDVGGADEGAEPGPYALAGTDQERLDGFHQLLTDDSIGAVIFARGGHGLLRVLPGIDWQLLARQPRSFVGYSDLTPLLGQIVDRLSWQTLHGPMVVSDLSKKEFSLVEESSLVRALAGDFSIPMKLHPTPGSAHEDGNGLIEAPLVGGCLSMLAATLGTEHSCSCQGRIVFIEDQGEPDYRIDRMLTHLQLSGKFVGIRALVVGHLRPPASAFLPLIEQFCLSPSIQSGAFSSKEPQTVRPLWLEGLIESSRRYAWPIFEGLFAGHGRPNLTIPLGRLVRIDSEAESLTFP